MNDKTSNAYFLGKDYTEEFFTKNGENLGIKCKICGRFWKTPEDEHHEKDCIYNVKTVYDWETEENRRLSKVAESLLSEIQNHEEAKKLSNKQLGDYLIENIWSKHDFKTMDSAVLNEVISRLEKFN